MPDIAFLRNAAMMTPEAAFRTYHLNEPDVTGHDSWLGPDARSVWGALEDHYQFTQAEPVYVGVDVSITRDCTAVVCVQQRPDGRLHAIARIWTPAPGREVDLVTVSAHILELSFQYDVRAVSYDPRFFEGEAARLEAQRVPVAKVPQTSEHMVPAIAALRAAIFKAGLTHEADEQFGAHVVNAVARPTDNSYTLSKSKSAPRGHIDACIALALAVDRYEHKAPLQRLFVG
jgi:phage terminase large subunit-like protein